jgi:hypothetical protein
MVPFMENITAPMRTPSHLWAITTPLQKADDAVSGLQRLVSAKMQTGGSWRASGKSSDALI